MQNTEKRIENVCSELQELLEIHANLNEIVMQQQLKVDALADNVGTAKNEIEKGTKELQEADKYHRMNRKKKWCFRIFLLFALLIIIAYLWALMST